MLVKTFTSMYFLTYAITFIIWIFREKKMLRWSQHWITNLPSDKCPLTIMQWHDNHRLEENIFTIGLISFMTNIYSIISKYDVNRYKQTILIKHYSHQSIASFQCVYPRLKHHSFYSLYNHNEATTLFKTDKVHQFTVESIKLVGINIRGLLQFYTFTRT